MDNTKKDNFSSREREMLAELMKTSLQCSEYRGAKEALHQQLITALARIEEVSVENFRGKELLKEGLELSITQQQTIAKLEARIKELDANNAQGSEIVKSQEGLILELIAALKPALFELKRSSVCLSGDINPIPLIEVAMKELKENGYV